MRGPRIKESARKNWALFSEIMCQKNVPIVIAITGLEHEPDIDAWWYRNKGAFQAAEMAPVGNACITAIKGKILKSGGHAFNEDYEESRVKMQKLIMAHHLVLPWKVKLVQWFTEVVNITYESQFCRGPKEHREIQESPGPGIAKLMQLCDMSEEEATEVARKLNGRF